MANPFPFVSGSVLLASELNGIGEAWTSYTPVIKGGATVVTATLSYAKFQRINKLVFVQVRAIVTSTGAVNGTAEISLPTGLDVLVPSTSRLLGTFLILKQGVAFYAGNAVAHTATTIAGLAFDAGDFMGNNTPALTLANTDQLSMSVCYEVA